VLLFRRLVTPQRFTLRRKAGESEEADKQFLCSCIKTLASGEKSGKTFAIMNSEQAQPRVCWIISQAGDAFILLSAISRRRVRVD
jgi:hypothetical protein